MMTLCPVYAKAECGFHDSFFGKQLYFKGTQRILTVNLKDLYSREKRYDGNLSYLQWRVLLKVTFLRKTFVV